MASSSGMLPRSWSSASVTSCCAERPLTAQASRSLRWRPGSRRSVNAALPLPPAAERGRGARRGVAAGARETTAATCAGAAPASGSDARPLPAREARRSRRSPLHGHRRRRSARRSRPAGCAPANGPGSGPVGWARGWLTTSSPKASWSRRAKHRRAWAARTHVVPAEVLEAAALWPKPWGRMAGRARPCEQEGRRREKRKAWLRATAFPLLTDDAAAEATDRTRTGLSNARRRAGRREHGAAEILFEPVGDIFPQLGHFIGGPALGSISITVRPSIIEAAKSVRW